MSSSGPLKAVIDDEFLTIVIIFLLFPNLFFPK